MLLYELPLLLRPVGRERERSSDEGERETESALTREEREQASQYRDWGDRRRRGRMISAKVVLLSTGTLSAAVALRLSAPAVSSFLFYEVPRIYAGLLLWLTPPYLYLVLNGIIISIAASSRFQKPAVRDEYIEGSEVAPLVPAAKAHAETRPEDPPPPPVVFEIGDGPEEEEGAGQEGLLLSTDGYGGKTGSAGGKAVVVRDSAAEGEGAEEEEEEEEEFVISRSSWTPKMRDPATEKPLVSARFGGRRGVKASPEGRALGVAKPRKYETLEGTWKTITDGRPMPLTRHLRKSDTWGADGGGRAREEAAATPPVRKAETFSERRVTAPSPGAGSSSSKGRVLRREASPGQEELNRRVEAFIKKFNEEMRLQRQESFQNYMDMIGRAAH